MRTNHPCLSWPPHVVCAPVALCCETNEHDVGILLSVQTVRNFVGLLLNTELCDKANTRQVVIPYDTHNLSSLTSRLSSLAALKPPNRNFCDKTKIEL